MKKLKFLLCASLLLTACGSNEANETTVTCEGIINGIETKVSLVHDDEKALRQTVENTTDYASYGVSEEEIQTLLEAAVASYEGVEGLSYTYDTKDGVLTETISVDYINGDLDVLEDLGIVDFGGQTGSIKYIDYKATLESYEQQGLTCK